MYERFTGAEGRRRLITALRSQPLAQGSEALAAALADAGELRLCPTGEDLITQGGDNNSLFLLCAGRVSVMVHGREVAIRAAGEHVGEMALLEPGAPRSATLRAVEDAVVLEVAEEKVHALAKDYPAIWHSMARVLADRLRQRDRLVTARAERPRLFVGSSSEGKDVAYAVQAALARYPVHVDLWTDDLFPPSHQTLEALEKRLPLIDFALLVLTADDVVRSRGKQRWAPRDNVVLEAGLFCGALGRGRTFLLVQAGDDLKIPSDLFGLTLLSFEPGATADLRARVGPACTQIREAVRDAGAR